MSHDKKTELVFAAGHRYSHGNITAERDWLKSRGRREEKRKRAGPSSLHVVRVGVQYLQPVWENHSMGCSINSAVCVCATAHPCCVQTGLKRSIREGYKSSPTGTGLNQWLCAFVCCLCTLV